MKVARILSVAVILLGVVSWCGCGGGNGSGSTGSEATGEDDLTQAKTLYVADLGPVGIEFFTRRGARVVELSAPDELTGDEDGYRTGTVRVGGAGSADCLFFQSPRGEWINVGRPNGRSITQEKSGYSYEATGFVLTSPIATISIEPNDPGYGDLTVNWP